MIKKKLTAADYFLMAANIIPVIGVWAWNWSPKEMFLIYCLETIIIGIFNLVKMAIVTIFKRNDTWYNNGSTTQQSGLFFMLFFVIHYGIFVFVQMAIFFGVSGIADGMHRRVPGYIANDADVSTLWKNIYSADYSYRRKHVLSFWRR